MTILKWIWEGLGYGSVPPMAAFYTLRTLMFILSFVLEDWALHELITNPRERTRAIALVASSYVTWTFQTHTFSNSIESLLVLWCIVLMRRIYENSESTMASACIGLAFMGVLGIFNRITFPAFLVIPSLQLIPHLFVRSLRIPLLLLTAFLTLLIAITVDTEIYAGTRPHLRNLWDTSIITPWNSLQYNLDPNNLAEHGLHPYWQHFGANLPQLLGPAVPLLLFSSRTNTLFWTAITGIAALSCFQHQEARFLLPAVPLLLSSIKIPTRFTQAWVISWILFNATLGALFGIYHQGGIVPAQTFLPTQQNIGHVFWWKTYSPPMWLDGEAAERIKTTDLMGLTESEMTSTLFNKASCEVDVLKRGKMRTLLVAPFSATFLDRYMDGPAAKKQIATIRLREVWRWRRHVGLDDLDFGEDGVVGTLRRVWGRRGLGIWEVVKKC
jgi:phosphatidylinositol glycan class Z